MKSQYLAMFSFMAAVVCGGALQAQQTQLTYAPSADCSPLINGQQASIAYGTTIDGEMRAGMADQMRALGELRYNSAIAWRQNEEARRQAADNDLHAEKIYFQMRKLNRESTLAEHPRLTAAEIKKINQSRLPRRLSPSELDPTWGTIYWPAVLQRAEFELARTTLNDIFAHRRDERFGLGTPAQHQVQQLTTEMRNELNSKIADMNQMEWIQAVRFVESLGYEARFSSSETPAPPAVAMNR
jgi:hypothetical protein